MTLFFRRAKLRHILEWSSLYRVTLLLSKINDDSDLDAEAAILYGKVSKSNVDDQFPLRGSMSCICMSYWVVEYESIFRTSHLLRYNCPIANPRKAMTTDA